MKVINYIGEHFYCDKIEFYGSVAYMVTVIDDEEHITTINVSDISIVKDK